MDIVIGKTAGFCFGVKRAVEGSLNQITNNLNNKKIYCLGELVHNKQVMEELENKGIKLIEDINKMNNNSKVIIRAHGIKKEIYEVLTNKQIELVDYTCPNVLKIHEIASKYTEEGYYIFVIGNKLHPETIGTISYCGINYSIIENEEDILQSITNFENSNTKKVLIIVQTTYSEIKYKSLIEKIQNSINKDINMVIKNTICAATSLRQKETEELSKKVDCMIIIGGKNSSNTKKLFEIATNNCQKAFLIETKNELNTNILKQYNKIGIMAGASTPKKNIDEVVNVLNENKEEYNV